MKKIFRYLRGELNGFYLSNLYETLNICTKDVKDFLAWFNKQQFDPNLTVPEVIYGVGHTAGVFLSKINKIETDSAFRVSESHFASDGTQISERGFYDTIKEVFKYQETVDPVDNNNFATSTYKSSLVGNEPVVGYISSDNEDVLDDKGNVKPESILSTPPVGTAYSKYYGDKFLFFTDGEKIFCKDIEEVVYFELFKVMQYIRYNGPSIRSLCRIVELLCPNKLVQITSIEVADNKRTLLVYYNYDNNVEIDDQQQRLIMWKYIVETKFPQVVLIENI